MIRDLLSAVVSLVAMLIAMATWMAIVIMLAP